MCFTSEDGEESNIEVQFHDVAVHHSMRISNYLRHTVAALSPQALALCCASSEDTPSKLVVVVLNGESFFARLFTSGVRPYEKDPYGRHGVTYTDKQPDKFYTF